jgi:NADH-quinone oxidoreductase subunit J
MILVTSLILIYLAFAAAFSVQAIEAIIFLILLFCNSAFILFYFQFDFFGLIFIIVYVGAIAVLFLFVVMMLNIKIYTKYDSLKSNIILNKYFIFFCLSFIFIHTIYNNYNFIFMISDNFLIRIDLFSNLNVFAQYFFNFFNLFFIIAGIILLVALVGAVVLTININEESYRISKEMDIKQLARSRSVKIF